MIFKKEKGVRLNMLLKNGDYQVFVENNPYITGIKYDSRKVTEGDLFFAIKGFKMDGTRYIPDAIQRGAVAVISELEPIKKFKRSWIRVKDSRAAMAYIASEFNSLPWKDLYMVGVTGTNGKTTITYLLKSIFRVAGKAPGILGTICYQIGDRKEKAGRTTPEAPELLSYLREMVDSGIDSCLMEVSSHSLDLKRVAGIRFDAAIFTNLTNDHLDYHGSMENYYNVKKALFSLMKRNGKVVINIDDIYGSRLKSELCGEDMKIIGVGKDDSADVRIADYKVDTTGTSIVLIINGKKWSLESKLLGKPNVYNIALSVAACYASKIKESDIIKGIHDVESIEGRLQRLDAGQDFAVFVDYAHSPDALMNVLLAVREITKSRVITVFGCGGDRDRTKRPMMGQHATVLSDICIITTDNPRSEDPKKIIDDILEGVKQVDNSEKCFVIEDRREAIGKAISLAHKGDTVLIAGKGHEDYQILGDNVIHFDDREEALNFLRRRLEFGD